MAFLATITLQPNQILCNALEKTLVFFNTVEFRNKGPTIFMCYRRISTIANIENKEKPFQGTIKLLLFSSVIGGFPLLLDPL